MATNWAGNVTYTGRVHRPASIDGLRRLVAGSARIRALGSGHSFNRIGDGPGELVSLDGLPPVIELDTAGAAVTVAAAVRYAALAPRLHAAGLALANLGSLPHLSVGGACATATHGSGEHNANLSTAVRAIELLTAEGDLLAVDRSTDGFDGMVVSLGALGVVTGLTLATVPAFEVRQYVYEDLPFDALDDRLLGAAYSVSLFTTWADPRFEQVWLKHRVDPQTADPQTADPQTAEPRTAEPGPPWPGARAATGQRHPIPGQPAARCTGQLGVPGPWHERLPHFRPGFVPSSGDELQSEHFVARADLIAALTALDGIRAVVAPVVQVSEIRTVAADGLWLSPCYRRDSATIHFTWRPEPAAVRVAIDAVEDRLAPFDARPHWGKLFGSRGELAIGRYERLADFRRLLDRFDPAGKFGNPFVDRLVHRSGPG